MRGRVFVHSIALILLEEIRIIMARASFPPKAKGTVSDVIGKFDTFSRLQFEGRYGKVYSTMSKSQREILQAFGLCDEKGIFTV